MSCLNESESEERDRDRSREREQPVKLEKVAEDTGRLIGKGIRKGWSVTKSLGKGLVDTLEEGGDRKDRKSLGCQFCGASIPQDSNFCSSCGKKLLED